MNNHDQDGFEYIYIEKRKASSNILVGRGSPMRRLLIIAGGIDHPPQDAQLVLETMLRNLKNTEVVHIHSLNVLPAELAFDVMVLYMHENEVSRSAIINFERYVGSGGGVLAIHSATASFMNSHEYHEILGGRFNQHGPISRFVLIPEVNLEIFRESSSFMVEDELYLHDTLPGVQPHFYALLDGKKIPVVWTYRYGIGRIFYAVPGHTLESMDNPNYQALLKTGLVWVCNGEKH